MNRFETMQRLLDTRKYFKLVCGAGNELPVVSTRSKR